MVLAVILAILVFEGYLVYEFYQNPKAFPLMDGKAENRSLIDTSGEDKALTDSKAKNSASSSGAGNEVGKPGTTSGSETTTADPRTVEFIHRAMPENIVDNSTYFDSPLTTGNPDASILVTRPSGQEGVAARDDHPIGVWYDVNRGGKWAVYHQDLAPMREGDTFSVAVLQGPNQFIHRVTPANTVADSTYIDHPFANGNPDVDVEVTPNWNPGGSTGVYNNHPVAVKYDPKRKRWAIYNKDSAPMPDGVAFNVAISQKTS